MKYLLGIDFGGGASKATLLSCEGDVVATSTTEYPTYYPKPGYVEQNPGDWICAIQANIKGILEKSGISPSDILCVALDAATHTAVIMDENFEVIRPAIYWTDTRSTEESEYLLKNHSGITDKQVLHKPSTIWTLPQLLWIKNNEPENFKKTKKILFAKDYVRHFLTDDYCTDYIEAEGSMFFDIEKMSWSEELCNVMGLDPALLPEVKKPSDIAGYITKKAAKETGLFEGTPVIAGTTDTVMEVFAAGAVNKGQMTLKLATAGRICVITDKPYPHKNIVNYSHITDGLFYPGTGTKSCAASLRWFRDTFGGDYKEFDEMAEKLPIGSDGLVFHPYLNGELTPYSNPDLCADFVGVRSFHTKAHFVRAVLEGVAMSMLDCKMVIDKMGMSHDGYAMVIGGGAKSPLWRQMIADTLGLKLIEMKYSDSSFGSAMLAGIAVGIFESSDAALSICNEKLSETIPDMNKHEEYMKLFKKYKAIQKALEPIYNGEY